MVNREAEYGQVPNRIIDISTFLSLSQSFKELERYIDSLTRTLTDNERRLQQTLPGMIKAFDKVEKQYSQSGTGKINASQAADLKVMLANKENILKWLDQLSKSNISGKSKNGRDDESFKFYVGQLETILDKMTSSMEKQYDQMTGYFKTVNDFRAKYGMPAIKMGNNNTSAQTAVAQTGVRDPLDTPLIRAMEKAIAKGLIPKNSAKAAILKANVMQSIPSNRRQFYDVMTRPSAFTAGMGYARQARFNAVAVAQNTGAYTGAGPEHISKLQRYTGIAHGLGTNTDLFKNIHNVLKGLPILGSMSKGALSMSSGASSANSIGKTLSKGFGKFTKIGKVGALLGGPIGAAIGATAVAVGMIYKQMKKSSPILQAVSSIFELAWNLLWMPLGNALGTVLLPMAEWLIDFAIAFNRLFTDFSWENLIQFFYSALQMMWGPIATLATSLPTLLVNTLIDNAIRFFDTVGLTGVADILRDVKDFNKEMRDKIINLPSILGDAMSTLATKIKESFKESLNLGNTVESIKDSGSKLLKGDIVGAAETAFKASPGGRLLSKVGLLASGGIVTRPSLNVVGEAGPEAVIPLDKANGFGATYVINIQGDVYGVSDLETRIERVIQRTANKSYYR